MSPLLRKLHEENKDTKNASSLIVAEKDREAIQDEYEESKSENPEKVDSSAVEEKLQPKEINQVFISTTCFHAYRGI